MKTSEIVSARELIESIESNCKEELKCSRRLKSRIIWAVQRIIDDRNSIKANVTNAVEGMQTYDPATHTKRKRNKNY